MQLIGLTGRAGCGKDTVARILCETQGFVQIALADPLRDGLKAMFGLSDDQISRRDLKETRIDWLGKSPRELMQTLGTEWGREQVSADIWLRVARRRIEKIKASPPCLHINGIVISDIRFENEADWLRAQGGCVWHIHRPAGCVLSIHTAAHSSEQHIPALDSEPHIDNTGDLDDLYTKVADILMEHIK